MSFTLQNDGVHAVGTVLKDDDDPRVVAVTVTNNVNGEYTLVERVTPSSDDESPLWTRYQVSHDDVAQRESQGLLEAVDTLSAKDVRTVESLASAHPKSVPDLESKLSL